MLNYRYSGLVLIAQTLLLAACNLSDITSAAKDIEGQLISSKVIDTREGARWVYLGGVAKFNTVFATNAGAVALFTDEVAVRNWTVNASLTSPSTRRVTDIGAQFMVSSTVMSDVQRAKVQLEQAIQLIDLHYDDLAGDAMKAHAYGLLGTIYSIVADYYCSGIAMSVSRYGGEFIPGPGLPTDSLYMRAVALSDSGLALNVDSMPLTNLLRVVKGRALNSMGKYKEAAEAVSMVPDHYHLGDVFQYRANQTGALPNVSIIFLREDVVHIINNKGINGMVWFTPDPSSQDQRVPIAEDGSGGYSSPALPEFILSKRSIAFVNGAEARLIEAERYLEEGNVDEFINQINRVRRLYKLRNGSVVSDTVDPGDRESRINLLFRERAFTFYLTGRRLGDLRRLTRHYGRDPEIVWPIGIIEDHPEGLTYGNNYLLVPEKWGEGSETVFNPKYYGCDGYDL